MAVDWYAAKFPLAAEALVIAIGEAIRLVRTLPRAWPLLRGRAGVRGKVIPRLGYTVIYLEREDEIVILAVAHQRRRPGYWARRNG